MKLQQISHLVEKHFPGFYRNEGQNLVAFVRAYYEWLEQTTQPVGRARTMLDYFDVDKSVEQFVASFKQKYLVNFPLLAETDQRTFIKKASDIYRAKGSQRAIELLFRLLFNEDIIVYYPAQDILRPSDAKWVTPIYIELSEATRTSSFLGQLVTGDESGATAVVARLAKRTIAGKTFDVAYIDNINGTFRTGEVVTPDGAVDGCPFVIGSLNEILINNAGQNFEVGDIVDVISAATGRQANARVAETGPATGKIDYILLDGGAGYTVDSTVIVSDKVLSFSSFRSESPYTVGFDFDELITQPLTYVPFFAAQGTFEDGSYVYGIDSNTDDVIAAGRFVQVGQNTSTGFGNGIINHANIAIVDISEVSNPSDTGSFEVGEEVFQYTPSTSIKDMLAIVLQANSSQAILDVQVGVVDEDVLLTGAVTNCTSNVSTVSVIGTDFTSNLISTITQQWSDIPATALVITESVEDRTSTGKVVGSNTSQIGLYEVDASKSFVAGDGAWFYSSITNARANILTVSVGDVGGFDIGAIVDPEQVIVYPDVIDTKNVANVNFLTISIDGNGIGSNVGFIESIIVLDGGSGYSNTDTVTFTGGSPSALAVGVVNTHSNGVISDIMITNIGSGYDSAPTVDVSGGTGADLRAVVNPGYGFVKNPDGDFNSVIDTCLRKQVVEIGAIGSLTNIDPGANNTASPFVKVINYDVAGFGRRHFKINISGNTKPFLLNENITQDIFDPSITLNVNNVSANFNQLQRETILQERSDGHTTFGELLTSVYDANTSTAVLRVRIANTANTFDTSNTIVGLTSLSTANIVSSSTNTIFQLAKGRVIGMTNTSIDIFRTRLSVSFAADSTIAGSVSGAQAQVISLVDIDDSPIYGTSAVVEATARSANGTITKVEVTDSGFGYTNGEIVTLKTVDRPFVATGIARLMRQGTGQGYWENTGSFISHDKVIQDSDFYQEFSYLIESTLSLERYADVVKDTVHVAGTKTFGRVRKSTLVDINLTSDDLADRKVVLGFTGGNNGSFTQFEEVAQLDGLNKTANGFVESVGVAVTVDGANTEFVIGEQVSRPTFFSNTSFGIIDDYFSDFNANTTTIYLKDVRGVFNSNGQVQTNFDRIQLTYNLTSTTGGVPVPFIYTEVVYQSNGTANVGVGNITSGNATHLIIKPATKLLVGTTQGTLSPGSTVFQREANNQPNTAVGIIGLSNSTVIEVIDPRGQFVSGKRLFTGTGNAQVISVGGKSNLFTKSNTVIARVANLTDVGFLDGEIVIQPATGALGTLSTGNTTFISINDVSGRFDLNPIVGQTSRVQADISEINGPFAIIGSTSGANAEILTIQSDRVLTTLAVDTSVGAINTLNVANVAGNFNRNQVIVGANSSTNATITTVQVQAY